MFDIGWSEMMVVAVIALLVIGPRELPRVMRTVGQWVRKAQSLAREFQRGIDDMAREADLEDAKKLVDAGRSIANPKKAVMDAIDPSGAIAEEGKSIKEAVEKEDAAKAARSAAPDGAAAPEAEVIAHPVKTAAPEAASAAAPEAAPEAAPNAAPEPVGEDGSQKTA